MAINDDKALLPTDVSPSYVASLHVPNLLDMIKHLISKVS